MPSDADVLAFRARVAAVRVDTSYGYRTRERVLATCDRALAGDVAARGTVVHWIVAGLYRDDV